MAFPKIGKVAPAFTLLDQDGNKVSLKQFNGKKNVALYFYPKAMTPGCTVQACGIRDSKKALEKIDTVVLGVSPDPVTKLGRFIEKQSLNFTLLSDEDHAITEKYGAWDLKKFMGREYEGIHRVTFVMDEKSKVLHVIKKPKTKDHANEILQLLNLK